ncbi:MAG: TIGR00730 family Rossman fold protein [Verrucomicrobia bacterium]|nr:TIGR00730 family Rossman fold protein [Verrucomicrobiota bacterium]
MRICVFLSSSEAVPAEYRDLATRMGKGIGAKGHTLVYGGNGNGLMGALAEGTRSAGGRIIGIVPRMLHEMGMTWPHCDELLITRDLRDRKARMDAEAEAFVALPGGLGTFEEILEVLNLKYLRYHRKPVIFLNKNGFYDPLFASFTRLYEERFTKRAIRQLYASLPEVEAVFRYLATYVPVEVEKKWYDRTTDET